MLGLPKGTVYLVPWTKEWENEFSNESKRIKLELGELILEVHHIGSTAVKNLSAKPILDIAIELKDFELGKLCVQGLEKIGYEYKGNNILPGRYYFSKGEPRTHQIHMYQTGSIFLKRQLAFRDFLNENKEALKEYQMLKEKLTKEHNTDKVTYSYAKTDFINNVMSKLELN